MDDGKTALAGERADTAQPVSGVDESNQRGVTVKDNHPLSRAPTTGLFGTRFSIQRSLGVGAMGAVYAAFDRVRGEHVALKTLHHMNASAIYAIKEEFRSLSDVVHPNLVNLYELFSDGEHWFFTMELIEGTDFLSHLVLSNVRRGPAEQGDYGHVRLAFQQLAAGIEAIHQAGKLHLDLKPSNVLVTRDGRVVILDFGLVRESSAHDLEELLGTPAYMAPEQASAGVVAPASDWYAMGVILFEALTQRRPFDGPAVRIIADKLLRVPPRPSDFLAQIPPDLEELCNGLLEREPERRPAPESIRAALGMGSPRLERGSLVPSSAPKPSFVGREAELARVHDCYAHALSEHGGLALLTAPSGMGKSALAAQFLANLAPSERALSFSGRCFERESVPYNGIDSLIDELGIHLVQMNEAEVQAFLSTDPSDLLRVFPVLRGVPAIARLCRQSTETADVKAARRCAVASLRELLGGLSRTRPVVLFIDDLQWADLDSVRLLVELIAPADLGAVFVLAACRSDEPLSCVALQTLRESYTARGAVERLHEIVIGPLDGAAGLALASAAGQGRDAAARAQQIVDEARGNPFFIEVLARLVSKGGELSADASLDGIIVEQVAAQSDEARRLLTVIAVAGQPIAPEVALAAAGIDARGRASLAELRAGRFVRTSGTPERELVETYHDRIRESIQASLPGSELSGCHGRLAAVLEAAGDAPPDFLARQFFGARDFDKAETYAVTAAEIAEKALAFERAAELYALASECVTDLGRQATLRTLQAGALVSSGRCVLAAERYLAAANAVDVERAFDLRRLAARQLFTAGHFEEAHDILKPLLARVSLRYPETPGEIQKRALIALLRLKFRGVGFRRTIPSERDLWLVRRIDVARSATEGLASTDPMRAASLMLEAVWMSLELGEPTRVSWALSHYGLLIGSNGSKRGLATSQRLFAQALELAEGARAVDAHAVVRLNRAKLALSLGDWNGALSHADDCSNHVRQECGDGWGYMTVAHNIALFALQASGQVQELSRRASEYVRVAADVGDSYAQVSVMIYSACGALAADDPAAARERVTQALSHWKREAFVFQSWLAVQAQAQCDLYEGRANLALERIQAAWPQLKKRLLLKLSVVRPFALRLRAISALSVAATRPSRERAPYLKLALGDARVLGRLERNDAGGWSSLIDAAVRHARGDTEGAVSCLEAASARFVAARMPLEAESAALRRGELVGGSAGRALQSASEQRLAALGVRAPARWAAMTTGVYQ